MVRRRVREDRQEATGSRIEDNLEAGRNADEDTGDVHGEPEPEQFDPAAESGTEPGPDGDGGSERKRRGGRPRGSKNRRSEKTETPNLTAELLLETHVMMALLLDTEELLLTEEEAQRLASSIARVETLYKPSWLSEEAKAWFGLVTACGSIYGPRLMKIYKKTRDAKPLDVVPIRVSESA